MTQGENSFVVKSTTSGTPAGSFYYYFTVTRLADVASTDAKLAATGGLTLSVGTLAPTYHQDKMVGYRATVAKDVDVYYGDGDRVR